MLLVFTDSDSLLQGCHQGWFKGDEDSPSIAYGLVTVCEWFCIGLYQGGIHVYGSPCTYVCTCIYIPGQNEE